MSAAPLISRSGADLRYSSYDVLVIGGGIAGLTAAVGAANRWHVGLITKGDLDETATFLAQGGIAAAMGEYDSPELHLKDTLEAGVGLCDDDAVRVLVEEGPARVQELEKLGAKFDRRDGKLILASEGAHSVPRVVRAGGDATGSVVASALAEAITSGSRVELHENEFVIDLLVDAGRCVGALSLDRQGELTVTLARAVVLASGGAGQVFAHTTNPLVATGDGQAMAYRAGAMMRDMEFMQFHPTALYGSENPTLLLTEALRGEGAYLRDDAGERFMVGSHPRAELAPRDVVVRHMKRVFDRDNTDHVWLDARHLDCAFLRERFPTVYTGLRGEGIRPLHPVDPHRAGLSLLHRRSAHRHLGPHHHPRALRVRRDGEHRHTRGEPPGFQLAARGTGVRRPHGAGAEPVSRGVRPGGAERSGWIWPTSLAEGTTRPW